LLVEYEVIKMIQGCIILDIEIADDLLLIKVLKNIQRGVFYNWMWFTSNAPEGIRT
jgi:hypothetical protein